MNNFKLSNHCQEISHRFGKFVSCLEIFLDLIVVPRILALCIIQKSNLLVCWRHDQCETWKLFKQRSLKHSASSAAGWFLLLFICRHCLANNMIFCLILIAQIVFIALMCRDVPVDWLVRKWTAEILNRKANR